jgi:hypothetical protein
MVDMKNEFEGTSMDVVGRINRWSGIAGRRIVLQTKIYNRSIGALSAFLIVVGVVGLFTLWWSYYQ